MHLLQQSESTAAQRRLPVALYDSDGLAVTGFTAGAGDIQMSKNGAAFTNAAGTLTELSDGAYYFEAGGSPTDDINTVGFFLLKFEDALIRTTFIWAQVVPWDPYDATRLGMTDPIPSSGITTAKFAAGAINAAAIADDAIDAGAIATGAITSAKFAAGAINAAAIATDAIDADALADGAITAATFAAGAIDAAAIATDAIDADALKGDAITEIQSGLATSAGVSAVETDTQDIQSRLPAALVGGRMDASVGAMAANVITAAAFAADAGAEIAAAVWEYVSEGAETVIEQIRMITAVALGSATGLTGASQVYKGEDGTTTRVAGTYAAGTRTVTTRNGA